MGFKCGIVGLPNVGQAHLAPARHDPKPHVTLGGLWIALVGVHVREVALG